MGIQMLVIMGLGTYAGIWIDEKLEFKKFPLFTIILSLSSVALALYVVLKDFLKNNKK
ncbi:MAG: AtpZ/AtpI family protein [Bacteroidetes bacterium]|nr:AtpZ/AtpI family protein [Bacteroidota bacterium]